MKTKILALTLALLMLVPMCVIGVSAETAVWSYSGRNSIFVGDTPTTTKKGGEGNFDSDTWTDNSTNSALSWDKIDPTATGWKKSVAIAATSSGTINMTGVDTFNVSADITGFSDKTDGPLSGRTRIIDIYDCYINSKNYSGIRYRSAGGDGTTLQYMKVVNNVEVAVYDFHHVAGNAGVDFELGKTFNVQISVIDGKTYVYIDGIAFDGIWNRSNDNSVPSTVALSDLSRIETETNFIGMKAESCSVKFENWKVTTDTFPMISGKAAVGETLTASYAGKTDGTWTWLKDGAVIGTGETFTLTGADAGSIISARWSDGTNSCDSHKVYVDGVGTPSEFVYVEGVQASLNGTAVRFVGGVKDGTTAQAIGFDVITVVGGTAYRWIDKSTHTVYKSVMANGEEYTLASADDYIFVYSVNNIPSTVDVETLKFVVAPYYYDADGVKKYGRTVTVDMADAQ